MFNTHSVNLSFDLHPKTMSGEGKNKLRGVNLKDDDKILEPVMGKFETTSQIFTKVW